MARIEYEVSIDARPEVVYIASQDYSIRYLWDPFPEKIELLDGATKIEKGVNHLKCEHADRKGRTITLLGVKYVSMPSKCFGDIIPGDRPEVSEVLGWCQGN